jgi:hypothetical protein
MAFFTGTTSSSALDQPHYRDLLVRLVAAATSKHVSALVVNAAGSGYTTGDILEIRHASEPSTTANTMPCRFEITASAGAVTGVTRILSAGAYSNRVTSATVNAGGANYAVGDILQLTGGTFKERAKFKVATLSGSAVATVTQFETGGAYTTLPGTTGAATVKVGPAAGTGSGCTLNLTTQAIVGTTGISSTAVTGGGTGATFDLTLTDTGHAEVRNSNDFSVNGLTDEKEVVLLGTVSGGDAPYAFFRSYTLGTTPNIRYGWIMGGMDNFNSGLALSAQANVGPGVDTTTGNVFLLLRDADETNTFSTGGYGTYSFQVTGRRLCGTKKAQPAATLTYQGFHVGLLNQYGTASESPYPFYVAGSSGVAQTATDAAGDVVTGLTELRNPGTTQCPAFFRHPGTGAWTRVQNVNSTTNTYVRSQTLYPLGQPNVASSSTSNEDLLSDDVDRNVFHEVGTAGYSKNEGGSADYLLMPDYGTNETWLVPCTVISSPSNADNETDATPRGELDGVFWMSGTKSDGAAMTPEDTITIGSQRYRVFINAGRSERYSFYCLKEA